MAKWHKANQVRWKYVRRAVLDRDGWLCQSCGAQLGLAHVDHKIPVHVNPALAWDMDNLQTLCRKCHRAKSEVDGSMPTLDPERLAWREYLRNQDVVE